MSVEAARPSDPCRSLVEAMADVVFTTDGEGRFVGPQPSWERFTGQTPEQYRDMGGFAPIHPDDRQRIAAAWLRAVAEKAMLVAEYRLWHAPTQAYRDVAANAVCVQNSSGQVVQWIGMLRDVTARHQRERDLRESEERYRFLAETIPQMLWTAGPDGLLDYVSAQVAAYFDRPREALLGFGWLQGVHPDDRAGVVSRWHDSLDSREPYETAFRLLRGVDNMWRWHLVRAMPMKDETGAVRQWFGTCTDFHDQKESEERLLRANRELEEFAYIASHDLREPLRMVNIYTQLLLNRIGPSALADEETQRWAGFIGSGVRRMEALIADLLTFSRLIHQDAPSVDPGNQPIADLTAALQLALAGLDESLAETGSSVHFGRLPRVPGDEHQFAQVFQNLVANAIKYRKPGAPARIEISAKPAECDWVIRVRDDGIGFAPEYGEKIFGLFKRLHTTEYPGTGLGLAICRRLVQRHGGEIRAESDGDGQGATFVLELRGFPPV